MTEAAAVVEVVCAVVERDSGEFLLASRPHGKVYAGWWEFPGGKVERGEAPAQALHRELAEELGIVVERAYPWLVREYRYAHGHVRLRFFRVVAWHGEPHPHEDQMLAWQRPGAVSVAPVLPANDPVLKALLLPALCGVTPVGAAGDRAFAGQLRAALDAGLRWVQVRDRTLPREQLTAFASAVCAHARPYGALVMVNGDEAAARASGADGLHLDAAQLAAATARPAFEWCGASCHSRGELERAAALGLDYAVLGPVRATPTHPGQEGMGWRRFSELVRGLPLPVIAIGGLGQGDLDAARRHGAHGIAAIRGAWGGPRAEADG